MRKTASVIMIVLAGFACSANAQTYIGQASPGAIPYWVTTSQLAPSGVLATGGIVVGGGAGAAPNTTTPCTLSSTTLSCVSSTSFSPVIQTTNNTSDTASSSHVLSKTRSGGNTLSNDVLGVYTFQGFANSAAQSSAAVSAVQTASSSGSNIPTKLFFQTSSASGLLIQNFSFDSNGHFSIVAGTPTLSVCNGAGSGFGNGSSDSAGTINSQTAAATTCTITFAATYTNVPHCVVSGWLTPITTMSATTSTLVVAFASTGAQKISYHCWGA